VLFQTILEVSGGGGGGDGDGGDEANMAIVDLYLEKVPVDLDMLEIVDALKDQVRTPYQVICLQECERMNILLNVIRSELTDLKMGLNGELNQTAAMEMLLGCLLINRIPEVWTDKYAYESLKGTDAWFIDLQERYDQYFAWTEMWQMPKSIKIALLFNPMSFLTAIVQATAREKNLPLDNMCI